MRIGLFGHAPAEAFEAACAWHPLHAAAKHVAIPSAAAFACKDMSFLLRHFSFLMGRLPRFLVRHDEWSACYPGIGRW
jgi:hypothetical protein